MSHRPLTVCKFGSSVLTSEEDIPIAVHEIYRAIRRGHRVVAVVSALGRTTDNLVSRARRYGSQPEPAGLAALLATGEATSAALLTLALDRAGIPTSLLDSAQVGLTTDGPILDAEPMELTASAVFKALEHRPVAVLPGFVGRTPDGATSLLGRGGSDLTALFVAHHLHADTCRLVKDTDGLYERDPAGPGPAPRRFTSVHYRDAEKLDASVIQPKAVRFARSHRIRFEVTSPGASNVTVVGPDPSRLEPPPVTGLPYRIALLGLGTVGLGVYRRLAAHPDRFQVVGIAVRDRAKHVNDGVDPDLLSTDPWEVARRPADLVVELLGGVNPAADIMDAALQSGRDVVTANKDVIARHGVRLHERAAASNARLEYSASVGGAVPVLEAVRLAGRDGTGRRITAIQGVLNGTTNFVLDQLSEGKSYNEAVRAAQENGFAEADPSSDLNGSDAAYKITILARAAFGEPFPFDQVQKCGIEHIRRADVQAARASGKVLRLVATCTRDPEGFTAQESITAQVRPALLSEQHALAGAFREENRALVFFDQGPPLLLSGKGAGRWPTTESVVADILDLYRERRTCLAPPVSAVAV
jgi:homoserine dehydrogenase